MNLFWEDILLKMGVLIRCETNQELFGAESRKNWLQQSD